MTDLTELVDKNIKATMNMLHIPKDLKENTNEAENGRY